MLGNEAFFERPSFASLHLAAVRPLESTALSAQGWGCFFSTGWKYGCSMASLAVSLCCWSYHRSLSRRSRASGLIRHLFSLWIKVFQCFHECCPKYSWSADLGLCDTYSDSHVAPLYPEPCQCEQTGHSHPAHERSACMLSHFNHVQFFAAPWTVVHQASLSMGFSQTRILVRRVAMPSSRGPSWPRVQTSVSYIS